MEESGHFRVPTALPPEKGSIVPLDRKLDVPNRQVGCFSEEKNLFHLPGFELGLLICPARRLVVTQTTLYRLHILFHKASN